MHLSYEQSASLETMIWLGTQVPTYETWRDFEPAYTHHPDILPTRTGIASR